MKMQIMMDLVSWKAELLFHLLKLVSDLVTYFCI